MRRRARVVIIGLLAWPLATAAPMHARGTLVLDPSGSQARAPGMPAVNPEQAERPPENVFASSESKAVAASSSAVGTQHMNMSATRRFSTGKEDSTTVKEESLAGSVCGCCGTSATGCCATGTNRPALGGGCCSACHDPIASFSSCCAEPLAHPTLDYFASLDTRINIFMWGDSTMYEQFGLLCRLTGGTHACGTGVPSVDARSRVQIPVPPVPDTHGGHSMTSGPRATTAASVTVYRHTGQAGHAVVSVTAAIQTHSALSARFAYDVLHQLVDADTDVSDGSWLLYIGGAGLHHLHHETITSDAKKNRCGCVRDWAAMRTLSDASFEMNLAYGLTKLASNYRGAALAYFNTHKICDEKFRTKEQREQAKACYRGDLAACYAGADVAVAERETFMDTMYDGRGTDAIARRERALLTEPGAISRDWTLVDGHRITERASCVATADGVHYNEETMMAEIEAALTVLRQHW